MKGRKQIYAYLQNIAAKLPNCHFNTHEVHMVQGAWLKQSGLKIKDIEDKGLYPYNMPVQLPVNHFNRLKTAYKSGGLEAVKKYVEHVKKIKNDN